MSEENVELVRRLGAAFGRGSLDDVLGFFDPEITWHEEDLSGWLSQTCICCADSFRLRGRTISCACLFVALSSSSIRRIDATDSGR